MISGNWPVIPCLLAKVLWFLCEFRLFHIIHPFSGAQLVPWSLLLRLHLFKITSNSHFGWKKTSQHSPKIRELQQFAVQNSSCFPSLSYIFPIFPHFFLYFSFQPPALRVCFCEALTATAIQVDFQAYAAYQGIAEVDRAVDSEGDTGLGERAPGDVLRFFSPKIIPDIHRYSRYSRGLPWYFMGFFDWSLIFGDYEGYCIWPYGISIGIPIGIWLIPYLSINEL